jgi:hypothetical protein
METFCDAHTLIVWEEIARKKKKSSPPTYTMYYSDSDILVDSELTLLGRLGFLSAADCSDCHGNFGRKTQSENNTMTSTWEAGTNLNQKKTHRCIVNITVRCTSCVYGSAYISSEASTIVSRLRLQYDSPSHDVVVST